MCTSPFYLLLCSSERKIFDPPSTYYIWGLCHANVMKSERAGGGGGGWGCGRYCCCTRLFTECIPTHLAYFLMRCHDDGSLAVVSPNVFAWTMCPSDNVSLGHCVPRTMCPLVNVSLGQCVSGTMCQLGKVSLTRVSRPPLQSENNHNSYLQKLGFSGCPAGHPGKPQAWLI